MNTPTYLFSATQTRAYRLLREFVYGVLTEYDLTPTDWSMLGIIVEAKDGVRQAEIARILHVKAPLITNMAQELEKKRLIQSVQNQFDARAKLLALTAEGKQTVKAIEANLHRALSELLDGVTEQEMQVYYRILTTIIANSEKLQSN